MIEEDDHVWYQDQGDVPISKHGQIPKWLIAVYIILPIWGIFTLFWYWNGNTQGYLDRGYWAELQEAANTKYPFINHSEPAMDDRIRK